MWSVSRNHNIREHTRAAMDRAVEAATPTWLPMVLLLGIQRLAGICNLVSCRRRRLQISSSELDQQHQPCAPRDGLMELSVSPLCCGMTCQSCDVLPCLGGIVTYACPHRHGVHLCGPCYIQQLGCPVGLPVGYVARQRKSLYEHGRLTPELDEFLHHCTEIDTNSSDTGWRDHESYVPAFKAGLEQELARDANGSAQGPDASGSAPASSSRAGVFKRTFGSI